MKKRAEIEEKYKWDLSDYFENSEAWEKTFEGLDGKIKKIEKFNGKLNDKKNILNCLKAIEDVDLDVEALYVYAHSLSDTDVANTTYQELVNKITSQLTKQAVATSFIVPQLSALSEEFLTQLLEDKAFSNYSKILKDVIREKKHTLSEECEKLLSGVTSFSDDFSLNFSNFENGDLKFKDIKNGKGKSLPMTQSLYNVYLRDSDPVLRENAFKELHDGFGRYNNFLTSNYLGSVKKDAFYANARRFETSLESALFYEQVESDVYNKLVEKVEENLNFDHTYFDLKRKLLGQKTFKISDVYYNPLKSKKKYTYEQALDLVCKALSLLGEDYVQKLRTMNDTGKIDVFPNENKHNGAYQTGAYGKSPIVLTNFNGNYDDVSTLAHELGHAMHTVHSNAAQSMANANYTIFLAEIASTVNETLLNDFMLKNTNVKDEKLFYLNEFISRFHATVFRQTMFASFESKIHSLVEGNKPVSTQVLNLEYFNLVKKYFGPKTKIFECVKYEWSRIPHLFTAFYVYKYATGLISAINIVDNLKTGKITVDDYKKFLSSGCTKDPITLLKIVKVDLSTDEPFDRAFRILNDYLKQLKELLR